MKQMLTFALAVLVTAVGITAGASKADADAGEVAAYRLSTATLKKVEDVVARLSAATAKDPALRERLSALGDSRDDEEASEPANLDEAVALMNSAPEFASTLKAAGLESREFLVFTFALFQAGLAESLSDPNAKPAPGASPVLAENIRWFREHKGSLERLTAEWRSLTAAAEADEPDDEEYDGD